MDGSRVPVRCHSMFSIQCYCPIYPAASLFLLVVCPSDLFCGGLSNCKLSHFLPWKVKLMLMQTHNLLQWLLKEAFFVKLILMALMAEIYCRALSDFGENKSILSISFK